ncbi:hypothetical protein L1D44_15275 [Shewanella sp. Isolate13]|uniref:hypothetical protein n=1 Tax=Shewanella sp. Isolate13 TaxID=2908531 RepID=UPI001EFC2DE6|nr:hypothetical protein [Shewanella sp. Isolate13]MCG9731156.1 hypothetical protein [Shewanella sp. Isolate13]
MGSIVPGAGTIVGAAAGASLGKHFGGKELNKCGQNEAVSDAISEVSNAISDAIDVASDAMHSMKNKLSKLWA